LDQAFLSFSWFKRLFLLASSFSFDVAEILASFFALDGAEHLGYVRRLSLAANIRQQSPGRAGRLLKK
jgi:hypothetical protein